MLKETKIGFRVILNLKFQTGSGSSFSKYGFGSDQNTRFPNPATGELICVLAWETSHKHQFCINVFKGGRTIRSIMEQRGPTLEKINFVKLKAVLRGSLNQPINMVAKTSMRIRVKIDQIRTRHLKKISIPNINKNQKRVRLRRDTNM